MKLNIKMKDDSLLNDIIIFYSKELNDTMMKTRKEFEEAMNGVKTIFFSGKYIQGGFIPQQVKNYEYIESDPSINELQAFNTEHEKLATEIIDNILFECNCSKGTSVQKIHYIIKTINKYN